MRIVVVRRTNISLAMVATGFLLAGCVQQPYEPPPIELQPYPPPISYRTAPDYRQPGPAPLAEPLPPPNPLGDTASPSDTLPPDDTGAIPLQQMPAPVPDTTSPDTTATPAATAPAPIQRTPNGPGNAVPLEGFRPMHGQTRLSP